MNIRQNMSGDYNKIRCNTEQEMRDELEDKIY